MLVSVYDACMDELRPLYERRAKEQQESADTLDREIRRQLEIMEESVEDNAEDDTGGGYSV